MIRKLGRGGFGEVWLAERRTKFVTTKVAVKLPLRDQVDPEAIRQEAMLWEQASGHPNVLPIIDADEYEGQIIIVSEFAPDGSLEQWLKQNGAMDVRQATYTSIDILNGLEFLHSRKIVHRDLKPANILLQGETPRLSDFGISRALITTVSSESLNISGTFAYMAPEAFDGERSIQTDIWSVGVNLHRFLTGNLPFPQKETTALIAGIMMQEPGPLPDSVPQDLKHVIAKALAKKPEDRYLFAREMRDELRSIAIDKFDRRSQPRDVLAAGLLLMPEDIADETIDRRSQGADRAVAKAAAGRNAAGKVLLVTAGTLILGLAIVSFLYFGSQNLGNNANTPVQPSPQSLTEEATNSIITGEDPTVRPETSGPGGDAKRANIAGNTERTIEANKPEVAVKAAANKEFEPASNSTPVNRYMLMNEPYSINAADAPYVYNRPVNAQRKVANKPVNANKRP